MQIERAQLSLVMWALGAASSGEGRAAALGEGPTVTALLTVGAGAGGGVGDPPGSVIAAELAAAVPVNP